MYENWIKEVVGGVGSGLIGLFVKNELAGKFLLSLGIR